MDPIIFVFITTINIVTSWEGWIAIILTAVVGYVIWQEMGISELIDKNTNTVNRVVEKCSTLEELILKQSRRTGKYNDTDT